MVGEHTPFIHKYKPKKLSDVIGNEEAVAILKDFAVQFKKRKKKALILYGDTGVGKTSAVHALAGELGFELFEMNASDVRNADAIQSMLGQALKSQSLFFGGKIILIDEIDGLAGTDDRGGVGAIVELLEHANFPIVLTANDPWIDKLSSLRKKCELVQFKALSAALVLARLKKIADIEKIKYDEDALVKLSHHSGGDMRSAINDLQIFGSDKIITIDEVDQLSERERTDTILNAMMKVFKTQDVKVAISSFDAINEDLEKIFLWIDYNMPLEYTNVNDLKKAYDNIALADVFFGRIRKWQYYRFYVYCYNLLSVGVALSKKEKYKKFVEYKPSSRILSIWIANSKNAKKKAVAEKIAQRTHTSKKEVIKSTMPYIKVIFKKNADSQMARKITDEMELNNEEIEWLKK
jgi:replication factor C large subunit